MLRRGIVALMAVVLADPWALGQEVAPDAVARAERDGDVAALSAAWSDDASPAEVRRRAEEALLRLGRRCWRGAWLPAEERARRLSVVVGERGLMRAERAALLAARARFAPWPAVGPRLLEAAARDGTVVPGQGREQVIVAWGNPTHVERLRAPDAEGRSVCWELWAFGDGRRVFLRDGCVFAKEAAPPRGE